MFGLGDEFVEATGRRGWWSVDEMWKVLLKRGWEGSERRFMWWYRMGRNEISTEGGDSEWRCRCIARCTSAYCCFLLGIHMGLVKWYVLDCFRMWGNDSESVADVVLLWRNTTLMWLITVLKTAPLWRGLVGWYCRRTGLWLDGFSVNRVLGGEGHWNRVDILLWGMPVLRGWNRRGDFTLLLLRIMNHRVKEVKLQSFSIRLYAALLTTRKTSQPLIPNSPVLYEILVTSSALEG